METKEKTRKITLAILACCVSIISHAQEQKIVTKFLFQTDKSGIVTKKIPVYSASNMKEMSVQNLFVIKEGEETKVRVVITDVDINATKSLLLYNSSGQVVTTFAITEKKTDFLLPQLEKGQYIISLKIGNKVRESRKINFM